jgi:hypothetical protein
MSRFYYAQINAANTVIAISDLSGEVVSNTMIAISEFDNGLMGTVWNGKEFTGDRYMEQEFFLNVPTQYFRNRFSNEEMYLLYGSEDVTIKIWLDDIRYRQTLVVGEKMENILKKMVELNILTQSRSNQIFQECSTYAG